ncbi:hypothetical protein Skr01_56580 [Sphaerisporangium krabiense]|uniref:Uncharacterized protein n=1 Tax=Sphaerisporangium krabiense TaxID=763782 RepID=A0A7W8ZB77_9ACTN|nr:hypothetical protein [Sphaerisporangium krabiense]MBB5630746.1 hypothetical protein [Sphaerisporangium krabiense]GII65573.1 hypothetical protein Skr01_56580 [Sphaerisporangium krabiense]
MVVEDPRAGGPQAGQAGQTGQYGAPYAVRPPMGNTTRYLCAGAYLDTGFRNRVLEETLRDEFRAIPPSYGDFDVAPVIHHCRRARTMLAVRDLLITLVFVVGLFTQFVTTLGWLFVLTPYALLTLDRIRRGPLVVRLLLWAWAIYSGFTIVITALVALFVSVLGPLVGLLLFGAPGTGASSLMLRSAGSTPVGVFAVPLATLGIALAYRVVTYLTLVGSLKPGSPEPEPARPDPPKLARRLDYIRRAQRGNVTMYANEDAFMGAGAIERAWSIAVELDRARGADGGERRQAPADIDPVELHAHVRDRLVQMRDGVLRQNESLHLLRMGDHVVTRGAFGTPGPGRPLHPLIIHGGPGKAPGHERPEDQGRPRYQATPEEIAAVIRHPQGGVRYYQRVTVGGSGQEIRDAHGGLVAPAEDLEVLTSAFIYLAVEGRMLYTQFVVTVLPPAKALYHIVDELPTMNVARLVWEAVRALKLHLLADVAAAPARLARTAWQAARRALTAPDPADYLVYRYGARLSAREIGAAPEPQTHIQVLDTLKYTKLIEQRLTEAVLDFLEERGIDTAGYRLQAASVSMNTLMVGAGGTVSGPVSFGAHSSATVNNLGRAPV